MLQCVCVNLKFRPGEGIKFWNTDGVPAADGMPELIDGVLGIALIILPDLNCTQLGKSIMLGNYYEKVIIIVLYH